MSQSGEKICIGLKFNLVHFNGPQTKFKIFEIPVFLTHLVDPQNFYIHHGMWILILKGSEY